MQTCGNINRIAVIGAGPAGIAAAKYLLAEKVFQDIQLFEQRAHAGGVWNYTPENDADGYLRVPETDPFAPNETPLWRTKKDERGASLKVPTFISPLYETLEANLPKELMQHKAAPFPYESQLFPAHQTIAKYLHEYASDVQHLVKYGTQVDTIKRTQNATSTLWSVATRDLVSGTRQVQDYDAVLVANGHYTLPFIPDISGIAEWNRRYPGVITHSKFYRRPNQYRGKRVVVVGKGYSGLDIASQILQVCEKPLYISTRDPESQQDDDSRMNLPNIVEFITPSSTDEPRSIRLGNGKIIRNVDCIIFCTGYLYSYPFISRDALSPPVVTDGLRTRNVYQHIFYNADPTLAFLALPQKVVPFPVSEAQAAVVAKVWAGRLSLPGEKAMQQWEREVVNKKGDNQKFHYLTSPADGEYLNQLHDWCLRTLGDAANVPKTNRASAAGKIPPRWNEKDFWIRERIMPMKLKFAALDPAAKQQIRFLEDLGFDYEDSLKQQDHQIA